MCRTYHDSLAFKATRVRRPVWPNQAIDAKLGIVYRIPKVSAIPPILHRLAILFSGGHNALVHPVPDEATLHRVCQSSKLDKIEGHDADFCYLQIT